jgi:hypothetical protein
MLQLESVVFCLASCVIRIDEDEALFPPCGNIQGCVIGLVNEASSRLRIVVSTDLLPVKSTFSSTNVPAACGELYPGA